MQIDPLEIIIKILLLMAIIILLAMAGDFSKKPYSITHNYEPISILNQKI